MSIVSATMANNDYFRIRCYGSNTTLSGEGKLEIATADDGNEPIYVRQYLAGSSGLYSTINHEACLLDANGNTSFPNKVTAKSFYDTDGYIFQGIYDNAGAHNSVYRGKDLTSYFNSGEMSAAIANGTFTDIFHGDYITKNNIEFEVLDCNYFFGIGDNGNECATNHVVMTVRHSIIKYAQMNNTNTIEGGYLGSDMWKTTIPIINESITSIWGSNHILKHREALSNAISATIHSNIGNDNYGATTSLDWVDVYCNLFNENMLFGNTLCTSSYLDIHERNTQLAAFRYNKYDVYTSNGYWLSAPSYNERFCIVYDLEQSQELASKSAGVSPYFLLY